MRKLTESVLRDCIRRLGQWLLAISLAAGVASGEDWPTYRHDNRRSGATAERLDAAALREQWVWRSPAPPQPAWHGPAKWDAFHNLRGLRSMRNYDPVFHVAAAGDAVYFGSSADDAVRCLDASTGRERWVFTADGPVRMAPSLADGRLYAGSDDGHAYCLAAADGKLLWRFTPTPGTRLVLNNGRLISFWPVRTGVLVDGGTAYFGAALLPWKPSYLCAVDAATGKPKGPGRYVAKHSGLTMEGAPLASSRALIVPQGRVSPLVFDRATGKVDGDFKGGGGCMAVLTDDDQLLHGPGNKAGWITASRATNRTQLASYPDGNAIAVAGKVAYLLTDRRLSALDRAARKPLWQVACAHPYELIVAGDVLFVGGEDEVAAFAAGGGKLLWRHRVRGRAYGLAVANGALLVSTDEGAIHCFRPTGEGEPVVAARPGPLEPPKATIEPNNDEALLGRWVFHRSQARTAKGRPMAGAVKGGRIQDLAGKSDGTIQGNADLVPAGELEALRLDGKTASVLLHADHKSAALPTREMTAEAWVRVDVPIEWGGLVGAIQDNGAYERGWLLGYRHAKFTFALAATGGADTLGYLAARQDFAKGEWHHVVSTYDGKTKRLYVNGRLANSSTDQQGDIRYPPKTWYEIGAYHDDNEYFRLTGQIHEVCVYRRCLSAEEIAARYKAKRHRFAGPLRLEDGPYVEFVGPASAVVRWQTRAPSPTIVAYGLGGLTERVEDARPKTDHEARLTGLRRNRLYRYRIASVVDGHQRHTPAYELDTFFNYSLPPVPERLASVSPQQQKEFAEAAAKLLARTGVRDGICLMTHFGHWPLACELARRSRLRIVGLNTSPERVAALRRALTRAGVYGTRVSVLCVEDYDRPPSPECFADLVVHGDGRFARPGGVTVGVASLTDDDPVVTRPPLPGSGEWSHQYGRADNSAYGGETLQGATSAADLEVQWVGRPGPRAQADRNGRKPSPLALNGRLFLQGLQRVIAIDAFNGTILWAKEVPDFLRFNVPRDCSNWCADPDHVFLAVRGQAVQLDAATGAVAETYAVQPGPRTEWRYDWGYIARHGDLVLGSAVKQDTAYTDFWGGEGWYDHKAAPKVCSDNLFALRKGTGQVAWEYADGVIVNSSITVGDDRVYFVETRNPEVEASDTRRVAMHELWQSQFLVALDARTGRKLWERLVDTVDGVTVFYLAHGGDRLVLVSSGGGVYHVSVHRAADGQPCWESRFPWHSDNHGGHMSRPAIVGGKLFVRPRVFDLATGKPLEPGMPNGGCGTYGATDRALIFRAGTVTMWDPASGKATNWPRLRPDCWISTIPACGMLLSPEGGGGCSCGAWMETSVGFLPLAGRP